MKAGLLSGRLYETRDAFDEVLIELLGIIGKLGGFFKLQPTNNNIMSVE